MQINTETWPVPSDEERLSCLRGEKIYKEISGNGQSSLIREKLQALTDYELHCLLLFSYYGDLDLEKDQRAYEIIESCLKVQMERTPVEIDFEAAYERFKRMINEEYGYSQE